MQTTMDYRRRRRRSGCLAPLLWAVAWVAGLATMLAVFWFWVPQIIVVRSPDGSIAEIRFDRSITMGRAVYEQVERGRRRHR